MSIFRLKSKTAKLVDPASDVTANVLFDFIAWHKSENGYIAEFQYSYDTEEDDKITNHPIKYLANIRNVDNATVNAIASQITPSTAVYVERENEFLVAGALAIIDIDKPFGLGKGDWTLV